MSVKARAGHRFWLFLVLALSDMPALALDVFNTSKQVPASPAGALVVEKLCSFDALSQPLPLQEAVERALCNNAKTREAWIGIKVQAASVGMGQAAYLPTLTASWQAMHNKSSTRVAEHPQLDSSLRATSQTQTVSLSWVLYDFGDRGASLDNAKALLAAAQANHDAALQEVFSSQAQSYYAAQYAQGALEAAREAEQAAHDSFMVSSKRVDRGIAPISDALQAQAAYVQAKVTRASAESALQNAMGSLASNMGLRPDAPISLPSAMVGTKPDADFERATATMMDEAVRQHPGVRAARAQLQAAEAKVRQVRAQGRPSISLVAKASRNDQPVRAYLGQPEYDAIARDDQVGLQVNIPLFEGFGRTYQVRQAQAQAELQNEALVEAQQKVRLDVWSSYQTLQAATQNLKNNGELLDIARRAYAATESRYKLGVSGMLELLSVQSSLATARRQQLQALTDWRTSRLQLAARLGSLGMWRIDEGQ